MGKNIYLPVKGSSVKLALFCIKCVQNKAPDPTDLHSIEEFLLANKLCQNMDLRVPLLTMMIT